MIDCILLDVPILDFIRHVFEIVAQVDQNQFNVTITFVLIASMQMVCEGRLVVADIPVYSSSVVYDDISSIMAVACITC